MVDVVEIDEIDCNVGYCIIGKLWWIVWEKNMLLYKGDWNCVVVLSDGVMFYSVFGVVSVILLDVVGSGVVVLLISLNDIVCVSLVDVW